MATSSSNLNTANLLREKMVESLQKLPETENVSSTVFNSVYGFHELNMYVYL